MREYVLNDLVQREKKNIYILALDGDTDFQPSAVMLLIDRLKLYPQVGAACGRIHPTGTGKIGAYMVFLLVLILIHILISNLNGSALYKPCKLNAFKSKQGCECLQLKSLTDCA